MDVNGMLYLVGRNTTVSVTCVPLVEGCRKSIVDHGLLPVRWTNPSHHDLQMMTPVLIIHGLPFLSVMVAFDYCLSTWRIVCPWWNHSLDYHQLLFHYDLHVSILLWKICYHNSLLRHNHETNSSCHCHTTGLLFVMLGGPSLMGL